MLLELPISEVLLEGKEEESAEGGREAEWWENNKEFSTNFIKTGEKEYNVGEVEGGVVPKLPVEGKGAWYHPREAGYVLM